MNVIRNTGSINIMQTTAPMPIPICNVRILSLPILKQIQWPDLVLYKTITREAMKRGRHIPSNQRPYLCNYRLHCKIPTGDAFVCSYCNRKFGGKSN